MADPDPATGSRDGPSTATRLPAISRSLQYMAVLVLAIILGVAAQQLMDVRGRLLADTARQMARLDMVFAEQTGRAVETVDLLLRDTIETVQNRRGTATDPASLADVLRRRVEGVRQMTGLAATDASGNVVASSAPDALPASATSLLRRYAAAPERGLQISEPFRQADGTWAALMVRAIPAPGDHFDGLVAACLNLRYFEDFYRAVELNENGAILLHRRDGTVLARYPHDDALVGQSYADLPPFRDILAHGIAGTVIMQSPRDGHWRVLAIRALKAFPLAVNVSVDQAMVMDPWWRQVLVLGGIATAASASVGALLLVLSRRSRQMEALAAEWRMARDAARLSNDRLLEQMQERERAEAALRQAQRVEALGQIVGGVAHDFNNLLAVVLGNADLLATAAKLEPQAATWVRTIRAAAERGAALTGQLLAFARRQPLLPRAVDLAALLRGMQGLLTSALGSRVKLAVQVVPGLWPALVDPTQVELMVLNLAINARDAMPEGGTLTIACDNATLGASDRPDQPPAGDYVRLAVADTGTGMPAEILARAFEPYFTTKGPGKGSGLGLSQVYGVARQSGGGVQIETAVGVGTTVMVLLPRADPAAAAAAPPAGAVRGGSVSVLLVDDDADVRRATAQLLANLGYVVTQAESGRSALAALEGGALPDALVTDVAMPEMSGMELAQTLWTTWPGLPVVFVSGDADPASLAGAEGLGRLLRKPFRPAELAVQIEAAMAAAGRSAAREPVKP